MHGREIARFTKGYDTIVLYEDGCAEITIKYIMQCNAVGHSMHPWNIEELKASGYKEDVSDLL